MNISSAVVYTELPRMEGVRAFLATLDGVEVHAETPDGKLVVTIEADSDSAAASTYETIERAPGVLSMALVFQQTESNPSSRS